MSYSYIRAGANGRRLTLDQRWGALMSHFKRRPSRRRKTAKTPIQRPEPVTADLLGKWIAWSPDGLRIVLTGESFQQVHAETERLGREDLIFQGIPKHIRTYIPGSEP